MKFAQGICLTAILMAVFCKKIFFRIKYHSLIFFFFLNPQQVALHTASATPAKPESAATNSTTAPTTSPTESLSARTPGALSSWTLCAPATRSRPTASTRPAASAMAPITCTTTLASPLAVMSPSVVLPVPSSFLLPLFLSLWLCCSEMTEQKRN